MDSSFDTKTMEGRAIKHTPAYTSPETNKDKKKRKKNDVSGLFASMMQFSGIPPPWMQLKNPINAEEFISLQHNLMVSDG